MVEGLGQGVSFSGTPLEFFRTVVLIAIDQQHVPPTGKDPSYPLQLISGLH